jgi:hypothetical protein
VVFEDGVYIRTDRDRLARITNQISHRRLTRASWK